MSGGFRFGFDLGSNDNTENDAQIIEASLPCTKSVTLKECERISENENHSRELRCIDINKCWQNWNLSHASIPCESIPLECNTCKAPFNKKQATIEPLKRISSTSSSSSSTQEMDLTHTDLISGQYEGGLKVWECSLDLCHYLSEQISTIEYNHHQNTIENETSSFYLETYKKALSPSGYTLELGCGHGLPGCLMAREGDDNKILFSDYNHFVLEQVTFPNVILNINHANKQTSITNRIAMMGGDWIDLSNQIYKQTALDTSQKDHSLDEQTMVSIELPPNGRFDLILAAETTYTEAAARDTAILLGKHLNINTGIGLISMKRYYFGVGGGVDAFRKAAESMVIDISNTTNIDGIAYTSGRLEVQTLKVYDNGVSNIRELIQVRCVST